MEQRHRCRGISLLAIVLVTLLIPTQAASENTMFYVEAMHIEDAQSGKKTIELDSDGNIYASFGNILGSVVNWYLGLYITKFVNKSWFPFKKKQLDKASSWYLKYGKWSLFFTWVPIIGDPLTIVAGIFRVPLIIFITIVSISKILRYIFVGYIALKLL